MRRLQSRITWHVLGGVLVTGVALSAIQRLGLARPLLLSLIVLALVGVTTAPLARRLSRPITRLTEASRRFGAGELSVRVPVPECRAPGCRHHGHHGHHGRRHHHDRADELLELTREWNQMADRVQAHMRGHKELLAAVSHELRSPLARLRVGLELLPRDAPGAAERLRALEEDVAELDRLIDDVLVASRLEATTAPPRRETVDLRVLLEEVAATAARDPGTAGREIVVSPGPGVKIDAEAALVRRAMWNLVQNAARHGAPPIRLAVERAAETGVVEIVVEDRGPGIPEAERAKVLEPFYRMDRARTPEAGRGFGLGLTIARRVAEAHGGRLTIGDAPGGGARIVIELPA